jgi:hypothetical protein
MINFAVQEERRRIGIIIVVVGKSQSSGKNQLIVSQLPGGARRSVEEREQQQSENELRGTWFAEGGAASWSRAATFVLGTVEMPVSGVRAAQG